MNQDYTKLMRDIEIAQRKAMEKALEDAQPWIIASGIWVLILVTWAVILIITAWHILRHQKGIDRLTWIFTALTLPLFGVVFYWILREQDEHSDLIALSRASLTSAPPTPSSQDIAASITAELGGRRIRQTKP